MLTQNRVAQAPLRILTIDDSKIIHMHVSKAFKNYNIELVFATDGVQGLAAATRVHPDIILLDVTMPVMDGIETLAKLKEDASLRAIPVIMLTSEAGKENVVKIARIGIRDYILKPFTEQIVVERVSRVIDLHPHEAESKVKTLDDPINILVVEDKQAIIEQIRDALSDRSWKIVGYGQCGEALNYTTKEIPDVILISLSLPEKGAFNLFHMIRSNQRTRSVPVFGLSVKTSVEEQTQAQTVGFSGIFTKPLATQELQYRLSKAMGIDTSRLYFQIEGSAMFVKIPNDPSTIVTADFSSYIQPKLLEMVDSGLSKLVVDATEVSKVDTNIIKMILNVIQTSKKLGVKFRVAGTQAFGDQAQVYEESKDFDIYPDRKSALDSF